MMQRKQAIILLAVSSGISLVLYLLAAKAYFRVGFPLDDAWIHQTYARNLALRGEWSFAAGEISGGSTAPLWSGLLGAGYLLGMPPLLGSSMLGWVCLFSTGWLVYRSIESETGTLPVTFVLMLTAGTVLEWHLIWSAVSGMETLLFGLLCLAILLMLRHPDNKWLMLGCLIGAAMWVRPDAVTLLGPIFLVGFVHTKQNSKRLSSLLKVSAGFFLFMMPYLLFNQWLSGEIWPTTFFAKQAEYALLQETPFINRLFSVMLPVMTGIGVMLLPGFVFQFAVVIRQRDWTAASWYLWWLGFHILYAWRLPVSYQHGRYLIPAMPIYLFLGLVGTWKLMQAIPTVRLQWVIRKTWSISVLAVGFVFWLIGSLTFARDVAVIESEMVETARWVKENLTKNQIIAVHDIGAVGYFTENRLVDLAGLISPEVIPFIRDEQALATFLTEKRVEYLITFPDWYPELVTCGEPVYVGGYRFSQELGGERMVVFRWLGDCLNYP